ILDPPPRLMSIQPRDVDRLPDLLRVMGLIEQLLLLRRFEYAPIIVAVASIGFAHRDGDALLLVVEFVRSLETAGRTLDEQDAVGRVWRDLGQPVIEKARDQGAVVTALGAGAGAEQIFPGDFARGLVDFTDVRVPAIPVVQLDLDAPRLAEIAQPRC